MRTTRAVAAIMALGLLLLTMTSALADPNTTLQDDGTTINGETDSTDTNNELSAAVANVTNDGRYIASVTDAIATSVLDAGAPATVTIEEVDAPGREDWYVTVGLDSELTDGTNSIGRDKVSVTSATTELVVAPDQLTATTPVDAVDVANGTVLGDGTGASTPATLFYVANQLTDGTTYTATYASTVDFNLDLTGYNGTISTLTAPFTVTLYH